MGKRRPPVRLGPIDAVGLAMRLRELHELGEDPRRERFPDPEELLLVLQHAERGADHLKQPLNSPIDVRAEAAIIRVTLWRHVEELVPEGQWAATKDARRAGVPWDALKGPLAVTTDAGALQKHLRQQAEMVRGDGEYRTPETARAHAKRQAAAERAERARVRTQDRRYTTAHDLARDLLAHREELLIGEHAEFWADLLTETIDDRETATERATFVGCVESFTRAIHQDAREQERAAATSEEAWLVLEEATGFTYPDRPQTTQRVPVGAGYQSGNRP